MRQITLIVHCHRIDMHGAALNLSRNAQPTRQILRKDSARQAILGIISNGNRLLLRLDRNDRDARPEGLGVVELHILVDTADDNRAHPRLRHLVRLRVPLVGLEVAVQDLRTGRDGRRDEPLILLDTGRRDEDGRGLVGAEGLRDGGPEGRREAVQHGAVHDDALGAHADLAAVQEGAEGAGAGRLVDVGVVEHDGGRLAAQLHQHGLERLAGRRGDDSADRRAAGEVDLLDGRVLDQRRGDLGRVGRAVVQDVEDARRQTRGREDGPDGPEAARGELGALEDGGVAGGEGVEDRADTKDVRRVPVVYIYSLVQLRRARYLMDFLSFWQNGVLGGGGRGELELTRVQFLG